VGGVVIMGILMMVVEGMGVRGMMDGIIVGIELVR
jgi:hypothetical protein